MITDLLFYKLLLLALVWLCLMVVDRVILDHSLQMLTLLDEDMIQTFSAQTAHESFANSIRLRRSIRRLQLFDAGANCHCRKLSGIFTITITNQIFRSFPPRRCLPQQLRRPFIGWVFCYSSMYYPSRFQFHHHKYIPLPE